MNLDSRGRQSAHIESQCSQRRLTSAASVFKGRRVRPALQESMPLLERWLNMVFKLHHRPDGLNMKFVRVERREMP